MTNSSVLPIDKERDSGETGPLTGSGRDYTRQALDRICKDHGIEGDNAVYLGDYLTSAKIIYATRIGHRLSKLNNKAIKRKLEQLGRQACKLRDELESLHPQVSKECVITYKNLREEAMTIGETARLSGIDVKSRPPRFDALVPYAALLEQVLRVAVEQVEPAQSGREPNDPLYAWVKEVSDFWVRILKRPYTLDTHQQIPVTEAGRFLSDCMEYLDPGAIPRISSQMRRYLKEENPPRKNPPRNQT